jgi:superoxide dismutase, Fe-Mn family
MYIAQNFKHLLGLQGLSDALLINHFTLYEGYVTNINKLNDALVELEKNDKFGTPEFAEMNRRFGWEWNGMRLHELYFGNLAKEKAVLGNGLLKEKIEKEWGTLAMWEKDFRAMGAMRGVGWVILYYDVSSERLFNVWVNEHDAGHLAGATPLLVMDMFEHAFMLDYGLKRADYIETFFHSIEVKNYVSFDSRKAT